MELSDKSEDIFYWFGRVAYAASIFEADLATILILLQKFDEEAIQDDIETNPERFLRRGSIEVFFKERADYIEGIVTRKTMGQLMKKANCILEHLKNVKNKENAISPVDDIIKILDNIPQEKWEEAIERRNYLFHHFFYEYDSKVHDKDLCEELLTRLINESKRFEELVNEVRAIFKRLLAAFSISHD